MTNGTLAEACLRKETARVNVLELLCAKEDWPDVVRELSFYSDIGFFSTEEYSEELAHGFAAEAAFVVQRAMMLMAQP